MKFVLLAPRRGEEVIAAEYDDFLNFTGLQPKELELRVLDEPGSQLGDFCDVAGVFIGGSPFTITSPVDDEWQPEVSQRLASFVEQAVDRATPPVFAACYGASLFAQHFGGKVGTEFGEEAGAAVVKATPEASSDPLCAGLPSSFSVLSGHKDSVVELPAEATLLLRGQACPVQMYRLGDNVWASQFHPEMDDARIRTRLSFYEDEGYFQPGHAAETYARLNGNDTRVSNSLLRRFVEFCLNTSRGQTPASAASFI